MIKFKQVFPISQPYAKTNVSALDQGFDQASMFRLNSYGFNSLMQRNSTRLSLYNTYNDMDSDPDIHRILNSFADEICNEDEEGMPIEIEYNVTDSNMMDNQTVEVLDNLLIQWVEILKLKSKFFDIVRQTIKYGDCFFLKLSNIQEWVYIPTVDIAGVELDEHSNISRYHITLNSYSRISHLFNKKGMDNIHQIIIPKENIVHFSLSNFMNVEAPFGDSVLYPALKYYKYLIMLESSILIYRIVRSPERRKFKIYTGNMPLVKQKAYVEQLKRELYQKRVNANSESSIDSVYNAMSYGEDFFFTVDKNGVGSDVDTLPSGQSLGELDDVMYFRHKVNNCLGVPTSWINPTNGEQNAQVNQGKVGIAYIEEQRFNARCLRIQRKLEPTLDVEFKNFVSASGFLIEDSLYNIKLPNPQNFALYRQVDLETQTTALFNSMSQHKMFSKRFLMEKYLKLTPDEINQNEILLKEEIGLSNAKPEEIPMIQLIYDDVCISGRQVAIPEHDTYNTSMALGAGGDTTDNGMGGFDFGGGGIENPEVMDVDNSLPEVEYGNENEPTEAPPTSEPNINDVVL